MATLMKYEFEKINQALHILLDQPEIYSHNLEEHGKFQHSFCLEKLTKVLKECDFQSTLWFFTYQHVYSRKESRKGKRKAKTPHKNNPSQSAYHHFMIVIYRKKNTPKKKVIDHVLFSQKKNKNTRSCIWSKCCVLVCAKPSKQ